MPRAVDQMAANHLRARLGLHRLEHAGALIGAPVLFARNETGGTSMVRPDQVCNSGMNVPMCRSDTIAAPPWNPVRAYSAL